MATQIDVETEVHRQHVRLNIPIAVEIDGTRFAVDDWSVGGFGVQGGVPQRGVDERVIARLHFPFEDFELSMAVPCQIVYVDDPKQRFGCRYTALSKGQASLFRQVVDGYVSGEIVSGGDLLAVLGREGGKERAALGGMEEDYLDEPTWGGRLKRVGGWLLMLLLAAGLVAAAGWGYRERYMVVRAENATIETPTQMPRAPASGIVEAIPSKPILTIGEPFAQIKRPDGSAVPVPSPCECTLLDWQVAPGIFAEAGDSIAILASAVDPLLVRAEVAFDRVDRVPIGTTAQIRIPGRAETSTGQVERIDLRPRAGAAANRTVPVWIKPDMPLPFEDLGSRVEVTFQ